MGPEFKKKVLAAATSSQLLRIAAVLPDMALVGSPKSRLTPHKGGGPRPQQLQWLSLTEHIYEALFLSLPSLTMAGVHQVPQPEQKREEVIHGNLGTSTLLVPDFFASTLI